jgi:hypothetical protein
MSSPPSAQLGTERGDDAKCGTSCASALHKQPSYPAKRGIQYAAAFRFHHWRFGILDHPLSRMMTVRIRFSNSSRRSQTQLRDLAAHSREFYPEHPALRNQRAQGMPGARCARSLVCDKKQSIRASSPRSHRIHPAFPAQWFTAYFVLSPAIGLVCHRRQRSCLR